MNKKQRFIGLTLRLILISFLLSFVQFASALTIPAQPSNYVNDYANLLSPNTVQQLDNQLKQFQQQTTNQIVVAVFPSLEQENLEDFAVRLEEQWKIGQKNKNNGVLLIIFAKEHKIRIEVGYGLEGAVPDALAEMIINNDIAPYFKKGDYNQGVVAGVNALVAATEHEYKAQPANSTLSILGFKLPSSILQHSLLILFIVFFVIHLLGYFLRNSRKRNNSVGNYNNTGYPFDNSRNDKDSDNFSGGGGSSGGGGASGGW